MIVRLIGLPTRETNSCHASSSAPPAHRQTISCNGKDEYRVDFVALDILVIAPRRLEDRRHSQDLAVFCELDEAEDLRLQKICHGTVNS